jgi:hypothetical protein
MNPYDGSIHELAEFVRARKSDDLKPEPEDLKCADGQTRKLIPIRRDLTAIEHAEMQIKLYSPCACGSGEKFKFCCYLQSESSAVPEHKP